MAIALMAWEEKFCLGLDEIDEQHKSLVDLINQIWESIIKRSDNQVIFSLIGELEKLRKPISDWPTVPAIFLGTQKSQPRYRFVRREYHFQRSSRACHSRGRFL